MSVATQLTRELARRLTPVALLNDRQLMDQVVNQIGGAARHWADRLASDDDGVVAARQLYQVLFQDRPPKPAWWATPLGQAVAATGYDPEFTVSGRNAARILAVSRHEIRRRFGTGDIDARLVLDALVGADA